MPPEEPEPGKAGLLAGLLGFLGTIRTFYQAALFIVLGGALLFGYLIYEARGRLLDALDVLLRPMPTIELADPTVLRTGMEHLQKDLDPPPTALAIWKMNVLANQRTLVVLIAPPDIKAALPYMQGGEVLPIFVRNQTRFNSVMIAILDGESPCFYPAADFWLRAPPPIVAERLQEVCAVGIPPTTEALVGTLAVGFPTALPPTSEALVTTALRATAATLVR